MTKKFSTVVEEVLSELGKDSFQGDVYREIAARVAGIPPESVTVEQRDIVRFTCFCLAYGGSLCSPPTRPRRLH